MQIFPFPFRPGVGLSPDLRQKLAAGSVIALGNFDGVHCAHRALLARAISIAHEKGLPAVVFTFADLPEPCLMTDSERADAFAALGFDAALFADFSDIRGMSPDDFVSHILIDTLHAAAAVCGFNYRFGAGAAGDAEQLRLLLGAQHAEVYVLDAVLDGDTPVSATRIRAALAAGDAEEAARLLGRPYALTSDVVPGAHLGHWLAVPTVNQYFPPHRLIPAFGVYFSQAIVDGARIPAVSDIGIRPTVSDGELPRCETHLLDFAAEDLYGKRIRVEFLHFHRPEHRFESLEALRYSMQDDVRKARDFFDFQTSR